MPQIVTHPKASSSSQAKNTYLINYLFPFGKEFRHVR